MGDNYHRHMFHCKFTNDLQNLYSRKAVFGLDLYEAGFGEQIEGMVKELFAGKGLAR